jgi:hypothetical protein
MEWILMIGFSFVIVGVCAIGITAFKRSRDGDCDE